MKKLLVVIIALALLMTPNYAKADERYKASYKTTEGDYYIEFEVRQKGLYLNNFYAGQKLDDYIIDGYCTYKGYWFDYVVWANPEQVIVEGTQKLSIGLLNHEDITFDVEMNGLAKDEEIGVKNKRLISGWEDHPSGRGIALLQHDKFEYELPFIPIFDAETGALVEGVMSYPNIDRDRTGIYDLEWLFVPNDPTYEPLTGTIRVNIKASEPGMEIPDEPTTPSLTATLVTLESRTAYDINLNNKVSGSKYRWTSSNPDVAKVNAKNGLVTAVSEGEALITCEITLPDGTIQTLKSIVTVGYDENAPSLTETVLDLEVGDKFDINLENKIAKSKYRWVSSDRSIIKVNSANGKVTAVGAGEAYVTCTITTPENQVIVLRCDINVTE